MSHPAADLLTKLSKAAQFRHPTGDRHILFHGKRLVPKAADGYRHLRAYLLRRQQIVARILVLGEIVRQNPAFKITSISETGAFWQFSRGFADMPACHTSPCLLLFNGQLPHLAAKSVTIQQEIILNFADVMLMPLHINRIDSFVDDKIGSKQAMVEAMRKVVLNGESYRAGLEHYRKIRSGNLHEFLAGFSSVSVGTVTVWDEDRQAYTTAQAGVLDDDLTELRLLFREYVDSDSTPPNYPEIENYRRDCGQK